MTMHARRRIYAPEDYDAFDFREHRAAPIKSDPGAYRLLALVIVTGVLAALGLWTCIEWGIAWL